MAQSDRIGSQTPHEPAQPEASGFKVADNDILPVLVVDLDGTLIRTDMLFETFWASCSTNALTPVQTLLVAPKGRAAIKRHLSEKTTILPASLPYNQDVIDYIQVWRKNGGRTALVSASDENIVHAIGAHLGIFDEVHGSDGTRNLKGPHKAGFLTERFGEGGYAYMGDSPADLPVWESASKAVTVDANTSLRTRADKTCEQPNISQRAHPPLDRI